MKFNQLAVEISLKSMHLNASQKVGDDEYTRETQSTCDCCNIELRCNEATVLFFNFITAIYCNY